MDQQVARPSPFQPMLGRPRQSIGALHAKPERKVPILTQLFIGFGFTLLAGAVFMALRNARGEDTLGPGGSDPFATASQLFILVVMTVYYYRKPNVLRSSIRPLGFYVAIISLCTISTLWSLYPYLTLKRSVTLTNCILFGIFCSEEAGFDETARIYGRTMLVLMILSIVAYVALPSVGKETAENYSNAMRGVFGQKNELAMSGLLAIVCYCYLLLNRPRRPLMTIFSMFFILASIVLSMSATSLGISMVIIGITMAIYLRRKGLAPLVVYGFLLVALPLAVIAVFDPQLLFALAGRDSSLTGRVPLWHLALGFVRERPLLGYGYSAFWNEESRYVQYIWTLIGWDAPSAHNGYIDLLLQVGIPGLLLYFAMWIWVVYYGTKAARAGAPEAIFVLLYMLAAIILNSDEGPLPYPDQWTSLMPLNLIFLYRWKVANAASRASMPDDANGRRRIAAASPLPLTFGPLRRGG